MEYEVLSSWTTWSSMIYFSVDKLQCWHIITLLSVNCNDGRIICSEMRTRPRSLLARAGAPVLWWCEAGHSHNTDPGPHTSQGDHYLVFIFGPFSKPEYICYSVFGTFQIQNIFGIVKLRSRSRSQVRSRSGPRSGLKGPRTKDQRPGPGLYIKFGLPLTTTHHHHHPVNFSSGDNAPKPLLNDF